jgi:hypothetical protein
LFRDDHVTPITGGPWFSVNFGNAKEGYLPARSPRTSKMRSYSTYFAPYLLEDNELVLSNTVVEGPELWVDPLTVEVIFFSRLLGEALIDAGYRSLFDLKKCKLVSESEESNHG